MIKHKGNQEYEGLSTDTKPLATDTAVNATFAETDTGFQYRNNGSVWLTYTSPSNTYNYKIYLDGANTRLISLHNGSVDTSNSDAKTVFDAAVALAGGPTIKTMPGTYLFSDQWNCNDKNFYLEGNRVAMNGNAGATGDTILKANFDHATKPLINEVNTVYSKQQFKNIVVDCDFRVAYGIDAFDVKETMPWLENVAVFNADIDGVSLANTTYVSIVNPIIARNAGTGLHWKGPTSANKVNTLLVLGGRITTNGYNIRTTGYAIGNEVIGCIMEGNNDYMPFTNSIRMDSNSARDNVFRDCSLEYFGAVNKEIIYDNGYNNRYENMRFGTFHSTYTPIRFGPTSRNNILANPQITCNSANTTAIIINDSGAMGNRVVNPAVSWSTPLDVVVKNAGTKHSLLLENLPVTGFHAIESHVPSSPERWGSMFLGVGWSETGLFTSMADVGAAGSAGAVAADEGRARRWTSAGAIGDNCGTNANTSTLFFRSWNPKMVVRFKVADAAQSRVYIGWVTNSVSPAGDDPLNALAGMYFGKISTNGDWVFMHNDATGATVIDDVLNIPADNLAHTIYLEEDAGAMYWQLDNNDLFKVTTEMPLSNSFMGPIIEMESVNAGAKTFDIFEAEVRCF